MNIHLSFFWKLILQTTNKSWFNLEIWDHFPVRLTTTSPLFVFSLHKTKLIDAYSDGKGLQSWDRGKRK